MKLGYPCLNHSIKCQGNKTFRLKSYSEKRLVETVENNLICLEKILDYNIQNGLLFFRITSDLVPFASHPICKFNWQRHFSEKFAKIGKKIIKNKIRISMHPDQFVLINSIDLEIFKRSVRELQYHCDVLDLMKLNSTHKVQIHVGGAYGDKKASIERFVKRYKLLSAKIKKRLVIENDDRIFNLDDCLKISRVAKIPVLFDVYHHELNPTNDNAEGALKKASATWQKKDGVPMVDFSHREKGLPRGKHASTLKPGQFREFLKIGDNFDFDVMFEIKDKEKSAIKALNILRHF